MSLFNEQTIREVISQWYQGFDDHKPIEHFQGLLASKDLYIDLPPQPSTSLEAFAQWFDNNCHTFFDGTHTIKDISIEINTDQAMATIPLHWSVRTWNPPAAKSTQLELDLIASLTFIKDKKSGRPLLIRYETNE